MIVATAGGQLMTIETSMRRPWWDGVRPMWEFLHVIGAAPNPPWRPDRWTVDTPPEAYPAAVVGDLVLLASPSGIVRGHAREDGAVVWETKLEAITAAPVVTGSGLLLGGVGTTWLLDLADGSILDEISVGDDLLDVIPVESGTFVLTSNGVDWRPVDVGEVGLNSTCQGGRFAPSCVSILSGDHARSRVTWKNRLSDIRAKGGGSA